MASPMESEQLAAAFDCIFGKGGWNSLDAESDFWAGCDESDSEY